MGMEIYVYTSSPKPDAESRRQVGSYCFPGTGDPEGVIPARWMSGDLAEFLSSDLDVLVVAMPLLESTRGLLGKEQFEILAKGPKKTFLSNVARGPIVDTDALVEALQSGKIRGAALDVTDPEPLPKGHPLWKAPNVFITPHIGWQSKKLFGRIADCLYNNLDRLDKGEPLLNVIKRGS
jgi:phosphoglycerate dehydrogenase-like enzyme